MAAEYRGSIKAGGQPVPGVTIAAIQGDKKAVTTTDERGVFRFADLSDGVWKLEVQMTGFETAQHEVGVAPGAPSPEWELKFLSESALGAAPARSDRPQTARPLRSGPDSSA